MISLMLILLGTLSGVALVIVLSQLLLIGGQVDAPVGPERSPQPDPVEPLLPPHEYRVLVSGETNGWANEAVWLQLVRSLDRLEADLGGSPSRALAPGLYSPDWLEQRVSHLEGLNGVAATKQPPPPRPPPPPVPATRLTRSPPPPRSSK